MYALQKFFNYITLIMAILTVGVSIYGIVQHQKMLLPLILLILTFVLNSISKIYNEKNINLTKEDKEFLNITDKKR